MRYNIRLIIISKDRTGKKRRWVEYFEVPYGRITLNKLWKIVEAIAKNRCVTRARKLLAFEIEGLEKIS